MLAWDLGDPQGDMLTNSAVIPQLGVTNTSVFHPMKGPMTTQTLRGLNTLEPFHWRGDRTNFTHFNIAFPGLMGSAPLSSPDMEAYRDFVNTLVFQPNPNQNLDRTLPATFAGADPRAGFTNYVVDQYVGGLTCNTCHTLPTARHGYRLATIDDLAQRDSSVVTAQAENRRSCRLPRLGDRRATRVRYVCRRRIRAGPQRGLWAGRVGYVAELADLLLE